MSRLQAELRRLYPVADAHDGHQVRAVALTLVRPAAWADVASVWNGVQAELGLPAPVIAVDGKGYQLWFSIAHAVPAEGATRFLDALRERYLPDLQAACVDVQLSPVAPPLEVAPGCWSAFVAPDLAALFADEPWLDLLPGADAQADLLSRHASIELGEWRQALERLGRGLTHPQAARAAEARMQDDLDPQRFLRDVLNDPTLELRVRVEAAKALLACEPTGRRS